MTPGQYRSGGRGIAISHASTETPYGLLMLGATDRGLCFVQFGDSESALLAQLEKEYPQAELTVMQDATRPLFLEWMRALVAHLKGESPDLDLPLDVAGTAFQSKVWRYLQKIPYGSVQSYAQVAAGIGSPGAARAVARACASNKTLLLVPCHRVIRGDGSLGGFRCGAERKRALIDQERTFSRLP